MRTPGRRPGRSVRGWIRRALRRGLRPLVARPGLVRHLGRVLRGVGLELHVAALATPGSPAGEVLFAAGPAVSTPIRMPNGTRPQEFSPDVFPALRFRVLEDAVVTARSSGAVTAEGVFRRRPATIVDEVLHPGAVPGLLACSAQAALVGWGRTRRVDAALFLGGMWSYNYYHWMTEYLPVLWAADHLPAELRGLPVLMDSSALALPAARRTLDALRGDRDVVAVDSGTYHRVGRLVTVDVPKLVRSRLRDDDFDVVLGEALHRDVMIRFRQDLMRALGVGSRSSRPASRILAIRPPGASRPDNQLEVAERLAPLGFAVVDPGGLDVAEQARLFRDAEVICGPAGAAMTNLMFAEAPGAAVVWGDERTDLRRSWWGNLSALGGVSTTMLALERRDPRSDLGHVDPDAVVRAVEDALAA